VLAHDRVEFLQFEFIGFTARVLLRDVKEAGIGAAHKLD
jgi:hypothetical protein